jgi:hypothetical protein
VKFIEKTGDWEVTGKAAQFTPAAPRTTALLKAKRFLKLLRDSGGVKKNRCVCARRPRMLFFLGK